MCLCTADQIRRFDTCLSTYMKRKLIFTHDEVLLKIRRPQAVLHTVVSSITPHQIDQCHQWTSHVHFKIYSADGSKIFQQILFHFCVSSVIIWRGTKERERSVLSLSVCHIVQQKVHQIRPCDVCKDFVVINYIAVHDECHIRKPLPTFRYRFRHKLLSH